MKELIEILQWTGAGINSCIHQLRMQLLKMIFTSWILLINVHLFWLNGFLEVLLSFKKTLQTVPFLNF